MAQINSMVRPGTPSFGRHPKLPQLLKDLDLGCIKFKLLQPNSLGSMAGWGEKQVDLVEDEYRKFLALRLLNPDTVIVPDGTVDLFWHQHVLDTQKYHDDCMLIFGSVMPHFPYFGLRGEDDKRELLQSFENTIRLYRGLFGEPPYETWSHSADCGRLGCAPGPP